MYSVGITVCELGNGEVPYRDIPSTLMLLEKLEDRVPYLFDASNCAQLAETGQGRLGCAGAEGEGEEVSTWLVVCCVVLWEEVFVCFPCCVCVGEGVFCFALWLCCFCGVLCYLVVFPGSQWKEGRKER